MFRNLTIAFNALTNGRLIFRRWHFIELSTYMDVLTQTDSPALVIVADAVRLDVLMADNGSRTFLYLRWQGSTVCCRRRSDGRHGNKNRK